jgi:hypothetical protein
MVLGAVHLRWLAIAIQVIITHQTTINICMRQMPISMHSSSPMHNHIHLQVQVHLLPHILHIKHYLCLQRSSNIRQRMLCSAVICTCITCVSASSCCVVKTGKTPRLL